MAKKHSLTLSVPTPCHEDWDKMTANEQGRHCASCNKTVIDFSLYTDRELVNFFKTAKRGTVCGRINEHQANNTIIVTEQNNRSFFHKLFLGSALASWLGFGTTAHAQENKSQISVQQSKSAHHAEALKKGETDTLCTVSGKVTNEKGKAVSEVEIYISDTNSINRVGYTDKSGNYTVSIPAKDIGQLLIITFNKEGYFMGSATFTESKLNQVNYVLRKRTKHSYHVVGDVAF